MEIESSCKKECEIVRERVNCVDEYVLSLVCWMRFVEHRWCWCCWRCCCCLFFYSSTSAYMYTNLIYVSIHYTYTRCKKRHVSWQCCYALFTCFQTVTARERERKKAVLLLLLLLLLLDACMKRNSDMKKRRRKTKQDDVNIERKSENQESTATAVGEQGKGVLMWRKKERKKKSAQQRRHM